MYERSMHYLHRNVGTLKENGVFITYRTEAHIFRKYDGLGLSFKVLRELLDCNCRKIVIILHRDDGSEVMLQAKPQDFLDKGVVYYDGQDAQRILPFSILAQGKLLEVRD